MRTIGIICEYNPFHYGHLHHIEEIKKKYPEALIILVLNGYFLERGEISFLTKENKTKIALKYGINLVIELPFIFGTQSADTFANEAIKRLNELKVTDIIFGSETNNVSALRKIAQKQLELNFNDKVKENLKNGYNYPSALANALELNFIYNPNDLLGISYIKSILLNKYNINVQTIKRTNDYHDLESNDKIISASNIRKKILNNEDIRNYLPSDVSKLINVPNYEIYFNLIKYKILTDNNLQNYLDVEEGIEYRLKKCIKKANNLSEFIGSVKTKRYTYNKINRILIHILIGLKKDDNLKDNSYIKILGFDKKGQKYLRSIKKEINLTKNPTIYNYELTASLIYDLICNTNTYQFELQNKPITHE